MCVEFTPVDVGGRPTKWRGLPVKDAMELGGFKDLVNNEKVEEPLEMLEGVNPDTPVLSKEDRKVIEIQTPVAI